MFNGYLFKIICILSFYYYIVLFKLCIYGFEEIVLIIFERIIYSLSIFSMNKNVNYFLFFYNKDCLNFFIVFVKGVWIYSYFMWYSKVMVINIYIVFKNIDILNYIIMWMLKDYYFVVVVYK